MCISENISISLIWDDPHPCFSGQFRHASAEVHLTPSQLDANELVKDTESYWAFHIPPHSKYKEMNGNICYL